MSKQKGRVGLYLVTSFLSLNEICFDSKKRTVRERERETERYSVRVGLWPRADRC
jgi:hypothetical protein